MSSYEKRTIKTAVLAVGDLISSASHGLRASVVAVRHRADGITEIAYDVESWGRRSRKVIKRKTGGNITIHVPVDAP